MNLEGIWQYYPQFAYKVTQVQRVYIKYLKLSNWQGVYAKIPTVEPSAADLGTDYSQCDPLHFS